MGLLDSVMGSLSQGGSGSGNSMLEAVMTLVNDPKVGGLEGLLAKFREGGLGEIAASWVSTGENLPISADQVSGALGSGQLDSIAESLGVSRSEASSKLADLLPGIVDKLTPDGQVPDMGALGGLLGSLKGKIG